LITIVSGLPRSGTSMMMQALKSGGMDILSDNMRQADESNPKGYWEYEKVKMLPKDNRWILQADGKALKIIAQLLKYIPMQLQYKIIFMERDLDEILISQEKMLARLGKDGGNNRLIKYAFSRQLKEIKKWIVHESNIDTLFVNYAQTINEPIKTMTEVRNFLDMELDVAAMSAVVDGNLYREKRK